MKVRVKQRQKSHRKLFFNTIIVLTILLLVYSLGSPGNSSALTSSKTWIVSQGDTLWSIAEDLEPTEDPRKLVSKIKKINNLSQSFIYPGQTLLVPAE